jgi:tRNA/rRNA methyltransferase
MDDLPGTEDREDAGPAGPLDASLLANVGIVLIEPQFGGNIGSVARAMKNNGLSDWTLVRPKQFRSNECEWMAKGALDLLDRAKIVDTEEEALGAFHVTVAVTRRTGRFRRPDFSPRQAARLLLPAARENRVALVFGREDDGLPGYVVDRCQYVLTIPTAPAMPVLNLAQAVLVCCYELYQATVEAPDFSLRRLARTESLEGMYRHMEAALSRLGFMVTGNPVHTMKLLRQIFSRAELDQKDVHVLRGVFRAIENYMNVVDKRLEERER